MIDEHRIQNNLETFSFPRIYGSDYERKAFQIAKEKVEALGIDPETQEFSFTNFYSIIYGRIMFLLTFWFLFVLYLNIRGFFTIINFVLIPLIFFIFFVISRYPDKLPIGKIYNSQNLYTRINSIDEASIQNKFNLILLAHLDSKGQRLDITQRVRMFVFWVYSLVISIFFIIFKNFLLPRYSILLYICGGIALSLHLISVMLIFYNTTNNNSKGALDDASGVVCLLELLNFYSKNLDNKLKNINIWFVFTGAEEGGTKGVRNFYKTFSQEIIDKNDVVVLNFDAIGTKVDLIKFGIKNHTNFPLQDLVLKNAKNYALNIKTRRVPIGVHTDGYYFNKKGYDELEFGDWDSYQFLHSERDTLDKIDISLLKKICIICIDSFKLYDDLIKVKV